MKTPMTTQRLDATLHLLGIKSPEAATLLGGKPPTDDDA